MSETENPLAGLDDLDVVNPEAVVDPSPEDSAAESTDTVEADGAETPEVDGDSESPISDAPVDEDAAEEADSAPDTASPPAAVGNSNLTSRAQRQHRQRGR